MIINGRPLPQVDACVLRYENGVIHTTSIVKDGKTSVARFCTPMDDSTVGDLTISNIEMFLGALSAHKDTVSVERIDENKIRLKSKNKQTTLVSSSNAPAFSHSNKTVEEWEKESLERINNISYKGSYTLKDGEVFEPIASFTVNAVLLSDAIKCGNVNSQKISQYRFFTDEDFELNVSIGNALKGETTTLLETLEDNKIQFSTVVEGGLDFVLQNAKGNVILHFIDFRKMGAGISLIMVFDGNIVFQREIPNV